MKVYAYVKYNGYARSNFGKFFYKDNLLKYFFMFRIKFRLKIFSLYNNRILQSEYFIYLKLNIFCIYFY